MTLCAFEPSPEAFAANYAQGGALVWARRLSDLETPVSALLKLGAERAGAFLLESVQGGDWRGRYSIIGFKPDLVWRVRDGRAVEVWLTAKGPAKAAVAVSHRKLASRDDAARRKEYWGEKLDALGKLLTS